MASIVIYFFATLCSVCSFFPLSAHWQQAQKAIESKEYSKALELYAGIEDKGFAVWWNIACLLREQKKQDKYLYALSQALHEAQTYYQYKKVLTAYAQELDISEWKRWLLGLAACMLSLASVWYKLTALLLLCLFLYFLQQKLCFGKYRFMVWLTGFVLLLWILVFCYVYFLKVNHYIIAPHSIQIYAGPDESFPSIGFIDSQSWLRIGHVHEKWMYVTSKNVCGWSKQLAHDSIIT